jgi:methylated-DNA-protein-cysteine methyltransferase-like protein
VNNILGSSASYNPASKMNDRYAAIYKAVRRIPRGRVATYGQIATIAGLDGHARQVGYALHKLPHDDVPWHRVVNAQGEVSPRSSGDSHEFQRELLLAEGVTFDKRSRIDLKEFGWKVKRRVRTRPGR